MIPQEFEDKLVEALNYFAEDTSRRCVFNGSCCYSEDALIELSMNIKDFMEYDEAKLLALKGTKPKGCMVGYFIDDPKLRYRLDMIFECPDVLTLPSLPEDLKIPKLVTDNVKILGHLQELHDTNGYWNTEVGLTKKGKKYLTEILTNYNLTLSKFDKLIK